MHRAWTPTLIAVGFLTLSASSQAALVEVTAPPLDDGDANAASRTACWGDVDGDGQLDLFVSNWGPNRLLRNDGDGTFTNTTSGAIDQNVSTHGVTWGDYDNDEDLDVFVFNNGVANRLVRNDAGTFVDATHGTLGDTGNSHCGAWGDYDRDGDLDLYMANFSGPNHLWRNDDGTFTDVSAPPLDDARSGASAAWVDYDDDGDLDLYQVYDSHTEPADRSNRIYRNDGGSFVDATTGPLADDGPGYGAAWADYDNDGDLDVYLSNIDAPNRLLRNDGDGAFADATSGDLGDGGRGFGSSWADYDNDGDLDLYLCNRLSPNRLFRNDGPSGFHDVATGTLADANVGWGAAWGDYDDDGDVDLYVAIHQTTNRLFRNDIEGTNHWLHVDLRGEQSNSFGVGARVRIVADGSPQVREVGTGDGSGSQNSPTAEFGLGISTIVETLEVCWPSGGCQTLHNVAVDQRITIVEETSTSAQIGPHALAPRLYANFPNPFNPDTRIRFDLPRPTAVTLVVYDVAGRRVRILRDRVWTDAGIHSVSWDGRSQAGDSVASGVYLVRLDAEEIRTTRRVVLLE